MKNKIIKNSLFILLASVLTLPLTSTKILADSGIHLPTLGSFNWPIVSLHGPRYAVGGTKFHAGIDFSPLPGDADLGYMIKSRTEGEIIDFIKGSSGGWRLIVRPPSDIKSLHEAGDFFYMHLFRNNGTVPGIQKSEDGDKKVVYTEVEVVDVTKPIEVDGRRSILKCKGIAFWKGEKGAMTLAKVLTKTICHDGIYGPHIDVPATSKVGAFEEIAPMGNSNNNTVTAHLHFGMNFGNGKTERDNPFYALKRTDVAPVEPFFSAVLPKNRGSVYLLDNSGFWIYIISETEYSLDKVDLKLIKEDGGIESVRFSFGGRPREFKENLKDDQIKQIPTDPKCEKSPTDWYYPQPTTQACKWDEEPSPRKWRFHVPYAIGTLPVGTHKLCVRMTSVNGYANTEDSCDTFVRSPRSDELYEGGHMFRLDFTGLHGLVAAPNDQGTRITWWDAATVAGNYHGGGYNDWYLPSMDELNMLFSLNSGGGFADDFYWSSTPLDAFPGDDRAGAVRFGEFALPYENVSFPRDNLLRVRAIRAF